MLFEKFVVSNYNVDVWLKFIQEGGITSNSFEMKRNYPASEMDMLLKITAEYMKLTKNEVMERFGEFLVPDLLKMYQSFVNPSWRTFDMLEHTEQVMHAAVRSGGVQANPPALHVTRVDDTLLYIDYYSRRKMACLGIGIIKGIARYYGESDKVHIIPKSNPDDERVQLRIEFDP
jgi:hypothetical protein